MERRGEHGYVRPYRTSPWAPVVEWNAVICECLSYSVTDKGAALRPAARLLLRVEIAQRNCNHADTTDITYCKNVVKFIKINEIMTV